MGLFRKGSKEKKRHRTQKLVLLGAGEAGKSTIFKQVTFLKHGLAKETALRYVEPMHFNCLEGIKTLIYQAQRRRTPFTPKGIELAGNIMKVALNEPITPALASMITHVWEKEVAIKEVFDDQSWGYLPNATRYMIESVQRIAAAGYIPTELDLVHCRHRTRGIEEMKFKVNDVEFTITDVGGQESERRKWSHAFEGIVAVMFVAAIGEYDKNMQEDDDRNRLLDSVELFGSICNLDIFRKTAIVLYLNKNDVFEEKFKRKIGNLQNAFPLPVLDDAGHVLEEGFEEYTGGWDQGEGQSYILRRFLERQDEANLEVTNSPSGRNIPGQEIYFHFTCALDRNNIRMVFDATQDIVLQQNLGVCKF